MQLPRTRPWAPDEDRIALGWPPILGCVFQTIHYRAREAYSLMQEEGMYAAARSVEILPTPGLAILCRHGSVDQQLTQRCCLMAQLSAPTLKRALSMAIEQRRVCCVTNRVMAQCFARLCGDPVDAAQARRQLHQMLVLVAPDKMQGLVAQLPGERVHAGMCHSAIQTLLFFRCLLDDPVWSAAIFAPGRLDYGQNSGPLGRCLAAVFSVLAAWGTVVLQACRCQAGVPPALRRSSATLALKGARRPSPLQGRPSAV